MELIQQLTEYFARHDRRLSQEQIDKLVDEGLYNPERKTIFRMNPPFIFHTCEEFRFTSYFKPKIRVEVSNYDRISGEESNPIGFIDKNYELVLYTTITFKKHTLTNFNEPCSWNSEHEAILAIQAFLKKNGYHYGRNYNARNIS